MPADLLAWGDADFFLEALGEIQGIGEAAGRGDIPHRIMALLNEMKGVGNAAMVHVLVKAQLHLLFESADELDCSCPHDTEARGASFYAILDTGGGLCYNFSKNAPRREYIERGWCQS